MSKYDENRKERMKWWHDAKFGMFVHWGCYSEYGRGEQIILRDHMPLDEYKKLADNFIPEEGWADKIAKQAVESGAKYVVLTTRHHDSYCLWDTVTTDFNAAKTGPGRDLIAEYVMALRKKGLKVGFYYSVINWTWNAFWNPEKYPEELPQIVNEMHNQVEELMTNYGKIDVLWYDIPKVPGSGTPGSFGYDESPIEATAADFYQSAKLNDRVRELQPHILINNRSGLPEDFGTPEQHIAPDPEGRAWESCMTINFAPNWANVHHSVADKTPGQILYYLVEAIRIGGNFLFNVGPDGKGNLCERDSEALKMIGKWLAKNGEAIYGTNPGNIYETPGQGACYHYGMFTEKGNTVYLTLFYYPEDFIVLSKIGGNVRSATILGTGETLTIEALKNRRWKLSGLPLTPPDELAVVIKIEFDENPYLLHYDDERWLNGEF